MKLINLISIPGLIAAIQAQNTIEFSRDSHPQVSETLKSGATWPDLKRAWAEFKYEFKKAYDTIHEDERRMKIWLENLLHIENHNIRYNNQEVSYSLKMNVFGDLNNDEFRQQRNGYLYSQRKNNSMLASSERMPVYMLDLDFDEDALPDNVDWRDHGYVTDVKDQGQCGSCWSFSTTGALEGQMKRKTGNLVSLSEQNLIDCSRREGNMGCNGGLMDNAFQYIKDQHGIDSEDSYPYEMRDDQPCRFKEAEIAGEDVGYVDIPQGSEKHLKDALATEGPVSVAIDAGHRSFQFYSEGIYYEPSCSSMQLDHGVLAVGYGVDENVTGKHNQYWLIKNSWSTKWGDNGYIKIARNRHNHCGVATAASYPLV